MNEIKTREQNDEFIKSLLYQMMLKELTSLPYEKNGALVGLRIGIECLYAKKTLPHGHFYKWLREQGPGYSKTSVNYKMRLARIFVEKNKEKFKGALP